VSTVDAHNAGLASSLVNTGQQVGGSIGLAILGTVAWTVVANTIHHSVAAAQSAAAKAAAAGHAVKPTAAQAAAAQKAITDHALAVGFSRGFEVSAGIALLGLIITLVMIRVKRSDLQGAMPPGMG
jgi:hypothetical protein